MTYINEFQNWVFIAQSRLERMQENLTNFEPESLDVLAELSVNIEELHVATEELYLQNEELLGSRQQVELERQRYVELFEFAPDAYFATDGEAIIQEVNRSASNLLNIPQRYLVGKPLDVFIAHTDRESFNSQWLEITTGFAQACQMALSSPRELTENDYATGNLIRDWEVHFQPRQGEPIPVEISLSATCDCQNHLKRLLWLVRDLRPSKQAEATIRQQAALLDVVTDAIWVQNLEGKILDWNQGAEKIYGWTAEEAIGKIGYQLLCDPASLPIRSAYQTTVQTGQWQGELQKTTKSGQEILVESSWTLVDEPSHIPQSIRIVEKNITEKKRLEKQLLQAQRLESLGTLTGGITHDLNNILTPILAITQVLKIKFPDVDSQTLKMLEIVESSSKRGAALVKQILEFTQGVEGKRITMQFTTVIDEIQQIVVETFPKSLELHTNIPQELWPICGNFNQLHQVLVNLCINARDAMPNGGILSISAENLQDEDLTRRHLGAKVGPYVAIAISDTGIGIADQNLDLIFDPFFTTKDVGQGTGLGLSTVAGIVKSHRGFIEVSSQVGKGTEFRVFLPAVVQIEPITPKDEELPPGNGELILVVDDEVVICQTNKTVLESFGYRVLTAENAQEGIELYTQHQSEISLVLIDMIMPSMNGATPIESLRKINPEVKIVAVSGVTNSDQIAKMIADQIQSFLPKPYTPKELLKTLHSVIHGN